MILDAFYILNEKSNICFSWIDIVKNNIKFLFINNGHKQNLVFKKYNIVCICDSYIKKIIISLFCFNVNSLGFYNTRKFRLR